VWQKPRVVTKFKSVPLWHFEMSQNVTKLRLPFTFGFRSERLSLCNLERPKVWRGGGEMMTFKWAISDLFPKYLGGYFALYEQNSHPKWQLRTRCGGHSCRRLVQALAHMLVPLMGSCSQFYLILHLHRVAEPFFPTFSSPWWNSFVQIYGGTTLLRQNLGPLLKNDPKQRKFGVGVIFCCKLPSWKPSFPYESGWKWQASGESLSHLGVVRSSCPRAHIQMLFFNNKDLTIGGSDGWFRSIW